MTTMRFSFDAKASDDADALTQTISATVAFTEAQMIVFCGRAVKVALASRFRSAVKKAAKDGKRFRSAEFVGMVLDAGDIIGATTDPAKTAARASKANARLSDEQKTAMIAELQASLAN